MQDSFALSFDNLGTFGKVKVIFIKDVENSMIEAISSMSTAASSLQNTTCLMESLNFCF